MIYKNDLLKLKSHLRFLKKNSPYYKVSLAKFSTSFIENLDKQSFRSLPLTSKKDISSKNDMFISSECDIAEFVTTSGTSSWPINIGLSKKDLKRLGQNEKMSFQTIGITNESIIQLSTTMDKRFIAGLAYYNGAIEIGATIIRNGPGVLKLQFESIQRYKPDVIIAVPSFLVKMIEYARLNNIDLKTLSLKKAICIGEPIRAINFNNNNLSQFINDNWPLELFSTYASTEMSTSFSECNYHIGNHVNSELCYTEVLKDDGSPATHKEYGEVVVTPLNVEGTPLLRYQTGDICQVFYDDCQCGNTNFRLGPILYRKNNLIKLKGTTTSLESIVEAVKGVIQNDLFAVEVQKNSFHQDEVFVYIENNILDSKVAKLRSELKSTLRVLPKITKKSTNYLESLLNNPDKRKKSHIIDNRTPFEI